MEQNVNDSFCADEQRIPSDITEGSDPFYSESNIRYLKKKYDALKAGTLPLVEHDLIEEVDDSDPFYSESNIRELKRRIDSIRDGTAKLEVHDLIED